MTNEEAIKILNEMIDYGWLISDMDKCVAIESLDMAINALKIFEQAKEAGFRGEEVEFYIGGRKFAIRELAQ